MARFRWLLIVVALWGSAQADAARSQTGPADARPARAISREDLAAFVDGFVRGRMRSEHVVGVTVSVVYGGEMLFARGYGQADLETGRPVRADLTLFRPGSISKTFTWTAVMQLYEQGKLDLDADISAYLPRQLEIGGGFAEPITLNDLMAHTPGYEDTVLGHLFSRDPQRPPDLLDYLQHHQPARVRPPGILPAYSNYGAALAGLIVANVSGEPWETYAERHLLEPLGMHHSTFREPWTAAQPAPMAEALAEHVSRGYVRENGGYRAGGFTFINRVGPAGALSTTATDMARWMLVHLNEGRLGDVRILRPETARFMHSRHFTMDPEMPGMAHGFIESRIRGYRAIGHTGGTVYFLSDMELVPELGLGVFISTNTAGGGARLMDEFVATLVDRYFPAGPQSLEDRPATPPGRPLGAYAGTYLSTRRPYTTVERLFLTNAARVSASPDGYLVVSAGGTGPIRLQPLGGDLFRTADSGAPVKFTAGGGGVDAMLLPMPVMVMQKVGPLADPLVLYGIMAGAALIMAAAVIGAWLRRNRTPPQTPAEAWAGALAVVTSLAWLATHGVAISSLLPLLNDVSRALFDFPTPGFVAALGMALGATVLTGLSVLLLIPVWRRGNWPLWRRLRHTGVVLAAIATALVLYDFNAIGFHYLPR